MAQINAVDTQVQLADVQFFVTSDKKQILCYDFHPTEPWIVICYDNNKNVIWDYNKRKKVKEFALETIIQRIVGESKPAELDKQKMGRVQFIKFYDKSTLEANLCSKMVGSKFSRQHKQKIESTFLDSWLIVVTELRVLFFDYIASLTREIKLSELGGKEQKICEVFWEGAPNLIAFGGVDGVLRLWDWERWELVKSLNGHKGTVTSIISFPLPSLPSLGIASADSSGQLILWEVLSEKVRASERAHKGEIESLSFDPFNKLLFTSGVDKNVCVWDLNGGKVKSCLSKEGKFHVHSFVHPRAQPTSILYTTKERVSVVHSLIEDSSNKVTLFNLHTLKDSKKSKINDIVVHPFRSSLVLLLLNKNSIYLLNYDHCLPPNAERNDKNMFWEESGEVKYSPIAFDSANLRQAAQHLQKVDKLMGSEKSIVQLSHSGNFLSVSNNSLSRVLVFQVASGKLLFESPAKSFCWSSNTEKFAVLVPVGTSVERKQTFKKTIKSITTGHNLQIHEFVKNGAEWKLQTVNERIPTKREVEQVFGGLLISVILQESERDASVLQFYSWNGNPVGHLFPEPNFVLWHPNHSLCLLSFSHKAYIYSTKPTFKLLCSHRLNITSAFWYNKSLFYSNATEIGFCLLLLFFSSLKFQTLSKNKK